MCEWGKPDAASHADYRGIFADVEAHAAVGSFDAARSATSSMSVVGLDCFI